MSRSLFIGSVLVIGLCAVANGQELAKRKDAPRLVKIFALEHANAKNMQRIVLDLFQQQSGYADSASRLRTSFDERTNSLIVIGPEEHLSVIEALVQRLDMQASSTEPQSARSSTKRPPAGSNPDNIAKVAGTQLHIDAHMPNDGAMEVISVVAAGKRVKKGELLLVVDTHPIEEAIHAQRMAVVHAKAEVEQSAAAVKNAQIQHETLMAVSKSRTELAKLALKEFQEGIRPLQLKVHQAEVEHAKFAVEEYEKRAALGLDDTTLSLAQAKLKLEVAVTKLATFEKYTLPKTLKQLEIAIDVAAREAAQTRVQSETDLRESEASLASQEAGLEYETARLNRLRENLSRCRILAPHAGVVAAGRNPVRVGSYIRPRQTVLILIPDEEVDAE